MRYRVNIAKVDREPVFSVSPKFEHDLFSFVSAGAIYHLEFVSRLEFIAVYTNGDVRRAMLTQVVRGDASRLSDAPLCVYTGHKNSFRPDLVRDIEAKLGCICPWYIPALGMCRG